MIRQTYVQTNEQLMLVHIINGLPVDWGDRNNKLCNQVGRLLTTGRNKMENKDWPREQTFASAGTVSVVAV